MTAISAAAMGLRMLVDGTLRITVDVEPKDAQQAFALFGRAGAPMAIAALAEGHAVPTEPVEIGPRCKWAVMRCKEEPFQQWVRQQYDVWCGGTGGGYGDAHPMGDFNGSWERYARQCLLVMCEVGSRKDLDSDEAAGERFDVLIRRPYLARETT